MISPEEPKNWPYKGSLQFGMDYYLKRDKALMVLTFMAAGRINEVLRVGTSQVDFEDDEDLIVVRNFYVSKRKKKTVEKRGPTEIEIPLPKNPQATLYPFTQLFLDYHNVLETEKLFPFGRGRAYTIINVSTGLWCHWFRALSLTYFADRIKNPFGLAKVFGIVNVNTILRYFSGERQQYRDVWTRARTNINEVEG